VHPKSAKLLAERLLELGVSAILDIFELAPDQRKEFVRNFLDALVDSRKDLWHPALVVLDEAHVYCPEKSDAVSADAVKSIATRGRKRGFCLIPATQRLSKLDKDVAAECNNKLIGRTVLDVDIKRASDELGFTSKADGLSLRDLEAGEFFAFGPALTKSVTKFRVGAVETEHPKAGAHLTAVVPQPSAKVRAVLSKLADLPQEAERKAATEAELRTTIQRLERELRAKPEAPKPQAPLTVEVPVLTDADVQTLNRVRASVDEISSALEALRSEVSTLSRTIASRQQQRQAAPPARVSAPQRPQPVRHVVASDQSELPQGERAVLIAAAQYDDGVTRDQLGVLTGYKRSTRDAYILRLTTKGYVDTSRGSVVATSEGIAALGSDYEPLPVGQDLIDWWMSRLPQGERDVLKVLIRANGDPVDRELIETETGFKRSTRDAYLQRLTSRRLVESVGRGQVKASDTLFDS
jgi:hypothetical protein